MSKVCFIGAGNMAEAIIDGMLDSKLFLKNDITTIDISEDRLNYINKKFEINTVLNSYEPIKHAEIIILAVKPQSIESIMEKLSIYFNENTLLITILAGVKIKKLENSFLQNSQKRIIRVMPNLGAFVRKSVSAIAYNIYVSENDKKLTELIFSSIGYVHECKEEDIDKVTAVSGSGPAYIFYFMEAFIEAAEKLGMSTKTAEDFCMETLEGAYLLLNRKNDSAKILREKVTSKGGTTEAAIKLLYNKNFKNSISDAVNAAFQRAKELGEK